MDVLDLITTILPKDILPQIITYGLFYFLLIFYGTEKWEKYTGFEKVIFPAIIGGVVWYFLVVPISFFLTMLHVFQNELPQIKFSDLYPNGIFLLYLIFMYMLIWRLIQNNKPLFDNNTFFNFTKYSILAIGIILTIADYTLLIAFLFSEYKEYLFYMETSILFSLGIIFLFYPLFLTLYGQKITTSQIDDFLTTLKSMETLLKTKISRYKTYKKKALFIIFIIILIGASFTGIYLLKTTTLINEEKPDVLLIPDMFIDRPNGILSGDLYVWQNYSIRFGLIPYAKIKPNISFRNRLGENTVSDYNFSGDYLLIKNSSWNTINVIFYGRKEETNISQFHTLDIKDLNDTSQIWDIRFNNPYSFDIEINSASIDKHKQLKLINSKKNNLRFMEIIDDPDNSHIIIKQLGLPHEEIYPNQSITLFFEKNNTIT